MALGHIGGTLYKLYVIHEFRTDVNLTQHKNVIKKCEMVLASQTKNIVPADKLMCTLREVTATVESIQLIKKHVRNSKSRTCIITPT